MGERASFCGDCGGGAGPNDGSFACRHTGVEGDDTEWPEVVTLEKAREEVKRLMTIRHPEQADLNELVEILGLEWP